MDELQAVVDVNLPGIVYLAETRLNPSIGNSLISQMVGVVFVFILTHIFRARGSCNMSHHKLNRCG